MDIQQIKDFLSQDWVGTREIISRSLRSDIDLLNRTNMDFLSCSGKQLRPMLSLLVARACNGGKTTRDSLYYAAAVELLHNATLLHDDVADDSDERRGRPTVNSILGPSASVLVGDFWLVKAVECVLAAEDISTKVIQDFTATLGKLAEGEMFQLQMASTARTSEQDYLRIITGKTASLFRTAGYSAAFSVAASSDLVDAACSYCLNLGLAFQIKDDIFDYVQTADIGKPVGADILEGKITLPLIGALRNVPADVEAHIRGLVANIGNAPQACGEINAFVKSNGGIEYATDRMMDYVDDAVSSLSAFEDSQEKIYLQQLAAYVSERNI